MPLRAIARRPPPRFPVPLLELSPSHWERPQTYVGIEDLHALRDVKSRWRPLVCALRRALQLRGRDVPHVAAAQLLVLYSFRGLPPFADPNFVSVGSPGVHLSNAAWAEVFGYCERHVIRGWQLLDELQLVVRQERRIEVLALGLQHSAGVIADGFIDAAGRPHYDAQLPTVTYLARDARGLLDEILAPFAGDPELGLQLQELAALVAPTLRILERRFGRSATIAPAAPRQRQLDLPDEAQGAAATDGKEKVTPSTAKLDLDQIGHADSTPELTAEPLSLFAKLPADPVGLLTNEGLADGLRWRGGSLDLFAELVARARSRYVWVPQKRLDRRYECHCGLQERERLGLEKAGEQHDVSCVLVGTARATGAFVRVRQVAYTAEQLLPEEWRDRPSFRERTESLLADVLLEASRQELRDFDLARAHPPLTAAASEPLVLPPHGDSARRRRRRFLTRRGETALSGWQRRLSQHAPPLPPKR